MDISTLENALKHDPHDAVTLINLGKLYINNGQIVEAIPLLRMAVRLFPDIFLGQNYLADAYYLTGEPREAIVHYERALHLRPSDTDVLANLWVCHQQIGDTSYRSQYGEDLWIAKRLVLPQSGIFVDVGAEDGISGSNTYHFETAGWTGVCIEPDPQIFERLKETRTCHCVEAAIGSDPLRPFYVHPNKGWSGLLNEGCGVPRAVTIRSLNAVLEAAEIEHIDLLSIDTEGTELDVLATLDLDKYAPSVIIIEWNTWDGKLNTRDAIESYFARRPYKQVLRTSSNLIFERLTAL